MPWARTIRRIGSIVCLEKGDGTVGKHTANYIRYLYCYTWEEDMDVHGWLQAQDES